MYVNLNSRTFVTKVVLIVSRKGEVKLNLIVMIEGQERQLKRTLHPSIEGFN